ncbi:MAG: DUF6120 family protein [Longibaculum sp.]
MNKQTKKYYQAIRRSFPVLGKTEKRYLQYVKTYLEEYEINHQQVQYLDLVEHFGTPLEIVSTFFEHIESEYIITHMKFKRFIKYASIVFITTVICIGGYILWSHYQIHQNYLENQIEYEEVVIEEMPY